MIYIALLLLGLGLWLYVGASRKREAVGFGAGQTISQDDVELRSHHLGLVGKPDRIVKVNNCWIPEEKKPGSKGVHLRKGGHLEKV